MKTAQLLPLTKSADNEQYEEYSPSSAFLPSVNPLSGAFHRCASAIQVSLIALGLIAALYLHYFDNKLGRYFNLAEVEL